MAIHDDSRYCAGEDRNGDGDGEDRPVAPGSKRESSKKSADFLAADFLELGPADLGGSFDVVVANPPFGAGRVELHHLRHMLGFLAPGGRLGAIMPQSLEFRDDAFTTETRATLEEHGARYETNAPGSFREAGTMASTVSVWLTEP